MEPIWWGLAVRVVDKPLVSLNMARAKGLHRKGIRGWIDLWDSTSMNWLEIDVLEDPFKLNRLKTLFLEMVIDNIPDGWPSNVLCVLSCSNSGPVGPG